MTNFEVLKNEIPKTNNPEEFYNVLNEFRWDLFPCKEDVHCIKDYTCTQCYKNWLEKEI